MRGLNVDMNLDAVKHFALDVWEDLKRTRLAGVAVGMTVALLAITAIVLRPGGPPEINTGYAAADAAPTEQISLALPDDAPEELKDIDLSAPRDPFQSVSSLGSGGEGTSDTPVDPDGLTTASSGSDGGSSGSGGGTSDTMTVSVDEDDALVPLDDLSTAETDSGSTTETTTTDTTSGDSDGGSDTAGTLKGDDEDAPETVSDYTYAADVQFGVEGALKRYRGVQRLEFVPGRSHPLLMFLGVKSDHKTMVFMVDSRLSQGGEGKCVPKPSLCTFIEVSEDSARDEHRFRDADGEEYLLRVRGVLRTTAKAGSVGGDSELPGSPSLVDGSR